MRQAHITLPALRLGSADAPAAVPDDAWTRPAANVDWPCWETVERIAGDFAHYASQVVGQPSDHYVHFSFDTSRATTPEALLEVVAVAARWLAASVRATDPESIGWHPHGFFTPAGFAAIGAAEALVHGADIAAGLGLVWAPSPERSQAVVDAVFPDAVAGAAPLEMLLAATGRPPGERRTWSYPAAATPPVV